MPKLRPKRSLRKGNQNPKCPEYRQRLWQRRTLVSRDGTLCALCGEQMPSNDMTVDHIVPLSKGGADTITNMQLAHSRCNMAKGSTLEAQEEDESTHSEDAD